MILTNQELKLIYPHSIEKTRLLYNPWIHKFMDRFGVNTSARLSAFLAQIGHETMQFLYTKEIASGRAYEGRKDLGNTQAGDGVRYKGRGAIMVTGRSNYGAFDVWLHENDFLLPDESVVTNPDMVSDRPDLFVLSAFWYWQKHDLNRWSTLKEEDFKILTRKINGGLNGYADRVNIWNRAKNILCKKI